jgi:hypothetical protein
MPAFFAATLSLTALAQPAEAQRVGTQTSSDTSSLTEKQKQHNAYIFVINKGFDIPINGMIHERQKKILESKAYGLDQRGIKLEKNCPSEQLANVFSAEFRQDLRRQIQSDSTFLKAVRDHFTDDYITASVNSRENSFTAPVERAARLYLYKFLVKGGDLADFQNITLSEDERTLAQFVKPDGSELNPYDKAYKRVLANKLNETYMMGGDSIDQYKYAKTEFQQQTKCDVSCIKEKNMSFSMNVRKLKDNIQKSLRFYFNEKLDDIIEQCKVTK